MSNVTLDVAVPAKVVSALLKSYAQFTFDIMTTVCSVVIDVAVPEEVIVSWGEFQETMANLPQPHLSQVMVNGTPLAKPPRKRTTSAVH